MTPTTFRPDAGDARAFRDALGTFPTGVTIVTCQSEKGPLGITANSFSSVSLDPPLVLWSPARASRRFAAFEAAQHFAIHVLAENQQHFCTTFASEGGNFSDLDWHTNDDGVPLINGCLTRFECERHAIHDGGDHAIIVGRVRAATVKDGSSLVFSGGAFGRFQELG
ncbi:MAG: flavin reductase family protein [Silicimonas sp.]|nr:flavin reductase family protein [Silicimonas sp.]